MSEDIKAVVSAIKVNAAALTDAETIPEVKTFLLVLGDLKYQLEGVESRERTKSTESGIMAFCKM